MEPIGLKLSIITAGFIGSMISLALVRNISPIRALMMVVAGSTSSFYLTPVAIYYTQLPAGSEHALAFVLGVTGMNALAGVFKLSENFAQNPSQTLSQHKKVKPSQDSQKDV